MNENIFWVLETEIGENKLEDLKALIKEMTEYTKSNEPGALNYEWFISEDNKKCTLYERYENSEATLVHLSSFGKNFAKRFMEILAPKRFIVYGSPDEDVKNALNKMGCIYMTPKGGFSR